MADREVIETSDAFHTALGALASGTGPIAVDAERASGFRYSQRAYLIQMFRRGSGTFLFDPTALESFDTLNTVIASEEWILHAATQDLTCLREVGLNPTRIFDTELASRLLGIPRVGLGAVVESVLGIHLAKEHSAADWSTRPLPEAWLEYAALDVEHLPDLRDALILQLEEAGKTEIALQEFADELTRNLVVTRSEPWRRLSGIHSLHDARQRAVARELWLSRDALARELDTAPGRLVPDSSLVAAASTLPPTKRALAELSDFTGRATRRYLDRWFDAIEVGRGSNDLPCPTQAGADTLPTLRLWPRRNPEADVRLKAAKEGLTQLSEELNIPLENLLTPETLRRLAWSPPSPLDLGTLATELSKYHARPWQIDAVSPVILAAFVDSQQRDDEVSSEVS